MTQNSEMQLLLKKIDDYFVSFPNAKGVSLLERELADIESLLYRLKGEGVIGLFDYTIIGTSHKKDALEDRLYMFDVDKENLEKFKRGIRNSAKNYPAKYDPGKMVITYQEKEIIIPPATNLSYLCRYMFAKKINTPISWDILYEEIIGEAPNNKDKNRKRIYDAVSNTNKKFKKIFPDQILFDWRGNSAIRVL